jgi:PhoH-like ATPase
MKKIYVLDTSVLLTDPNSIYSYGSNDVVIPFEVLEEVDNHKKRQDIVGSYARQSIRILDGFRKAGSLHSGVKIGNKKGKIRVYGYDPFCMPDEFYPDKSKLAGKRKVVVVSRDINMRVKCDSLGIPTEDYNTEVVVDSLRELYTGVADLSVPDTLIDSFYENGECTVEKRLHPNQCVVLKANSNEKKSALAYYDPSSKSLKKLKKYSDGVFRIKPRNKEQTFAMNLLMNKDIPVVSLIGKAGCGKTLLAVAAGLYQVLQSEDYGKIIISRPIQPMGKDLGYLPGNIEEKMSPWLAPIKDNLEFLMNNSMDPMKELMGQGKLQVEALTYIRGRSINDSFIIIDEAQNISKHELKTVITRVGENTKIILTGDVEQIDNPYLHQTSNGLSNAVEKFKFEEIAGHITLRKGERSKVATIAANIL